MPKPCLAARGRGSRRGAVGSGLPACLTGQRLPPKRLCRQYARGTGGVLADDMGLGKTVQVGGPGTCHSQWQRWERWPGSLLPPTCTLRWCWAADSGERTSAGAGHWLRGGAARQVGRPRRRLLSRAAGGWQRGGRNTAGSRDCGGMTAWTASSLLEPCGRRHKAPVR